MKNGHILAIPSPLWQGVTCCYLGWIGWIGGRWLIFRDTDRPPANKPESLSLFISHYEIVTSQLQSNHYDVHWAFCPDDIAVICGTVHRAWQGAYHTVWEWSAVGKVCMCCTIPNNTLLHRYWPSYDQRLYSQCLKQFWFPGGVTHTLMPTLRINNEKKSNKKTDQ